MLVKLPPTMSVNHPLKRLLKLAGDATGGEVTAEVIKWGFDKGLYLHAEGVTLSASRLPNAHLSAAGLRFSIAVLPFFTGKLLIKKLSLENPVLRWQKSNTPLPVAAADTDAGNRSLPLTVEVQEFLISDGCVRLNTGNEEAGTLDIQGVKFEAFNLSTGSLSAFDFQATLGEKGSIQGDGQMRGPGVKSDGPLLKLHAQFKDIDAGLLHKLIPATNSKIELGGSIAGHVDYAGNPSTGGDLRGELELGALQYQDSTRWSAPLPGQPTRVNLDMAVDEGVLSVRQLQLNMPDMSATAQFRVEEYLSNPTIKGASVSGNLSICAAANLVPWPLLEKQGTYMRQIIAEGGNLKLETQALPDIPLFTPAADREVLLRQCTAALTVSNVLLPGAGLRPRLHILEGILRLREGVLSCAHINTRTGAVSLPPLSLTATHLLSSPRITLSAEGPAVVDVGENAAQDETLAYWGIQKFDGTAEVAVKLHYDRALSDPLLAEGSIDVRGLQITTARSGSRLGFDGVIQLDNKHGPELQLRHCKATVNHSPLDIHGVISGIRTRSFLVDLEIRADAVELSPFAEVIPPLAASGLKGTLTANTTLNYSSAEPENIALTGKLGAQGLALSSAGANIEDGEIQINLKTDRIMVEKVAFVLNGQAMGLRGNITALPRLVASLHLSSPEVDIDRLLPIDRYLSQRVEPGEDGEQLQEQSVRPATTPPEIIKNAELTLSIDVDKGWYRGQRFTDLILAAKLSDTKLDNHNFDVRIAGGRAHTRGSANFSNLDKIDYDIRYDINSVQLQQFLPLIYDDPSPYSGQASSKGSLHGVIDSDFVENLRGTITIKAGPGKLPKSSALGGALHSAMAFARLKGLLTGSMREFNQARLVPFDHFFIQGQFNEKRIDIPVMALNTPGVKTDWKGHLLLPDQTLRMDVEVSLLGGLDTALGLMPVLGATANKMSKIYLKLDGPLDDPSVEKTLWNSLEEVRKRPLQTLEKNVGKSLKTIRKFWR